MKPTEGYTIKSGFEAVAQQVPQLKQSMAQHDHFATQMSAGAAQTETAVMQISTVLDEYRKETQKHFDDVRSEVSVKLVEVNEKMSIIQAAFTGVPSAYPPGCGLQGDRDSSHYGSWQQQEWTPHTPEVPGGTAESWSAFTVLPWSSGLFGVPRCITARQL